MTIAPQIIRTVALLLGASGLLGAQEEIIYEDFTSDNGGSPGTDLQGPLNPAGFMAWHVRDGSVDLVVGTEADTSGKLVGNYVDLGGSSGNSGVFAYAKALCLRPGVRYTLRFRYNSRDGTVRKLRVGFGDRTVVISANSKSFTDFSEEFTFSRSFTFTGMPGQSVADSPLRFEDIGGGAGGIGIDEIVLTENESAGSAASTTTIPGDKALKERTDSATTEVLSATHRLPVSEGYGFIDGRPRPGE